MPTPKQPPEDPNVKTIDVDPSTLLFIVAAVLLVPLLIMGFLFQ